MRIAQVSPLYESVPPKFYGGTERIVHYLTEELVRKGHEVTLFASGDSTTSARLVSPCTDSLRLNDNCLDHLAHHLILLEQVFGRREQFDIIHFHLDYLHFPFSRRHGVPNITTLHGRLDIPDLVPLYREFREMKVVSISGSQRRPLSWIEWQGTVHHGLPPDLYRLGQGEGGYLAFLGRVSPEKGLANAVHIACQARMILKVAAKIDKADRDYFEETLRPLMDHQLVEFVGEIGEKDKNDFLGNARALLFPIEWDEPFGLVMIESMACGTPVIAFPRGSVPEVIRDGISGFLVSSIDEAAAAVGRISEIDRRLCRRDFLERFSAGRMAKDYLTIYDAVIRLGEGRRAKFMADQGGRDAGRYTGSYTG